MRCTRQHRPHLDLEEAKAQLRAFRELLAEYVSSAASVAAPVPQTYKLGYHDAPLIATIGVLTTAHRFLETLAAIDVCLDAVDAITNAGGMGPYLRDHIALQTSGDQRERP